MKFPKIPPCPIGHETTFVYYDEESGMHYAKCECGWIGPPEKTERGAVSTWGERNSAVNASLNKQLEIVYHLAKRGQRGEPGKAIEAILRELCRGERIVIKC
jgi:hypothetical protein